MTTMFITNTGGVPLHLFEGKFVLSPGHTKEIDSDLAKSQEVKDVEARGWARVTKTKESAPKVAPSEQVEQIELAANPYEGSLEVPKDEESAEVAETSEPTKRGRKAKVDATDSEE